MAKTTDRPLMRQKIRVSSVLLNKWEKEFLFDCRHIVHGSLLEPTDLGAEFTHQDRKFQIAGMGEGRNVMLREIREEGIFYWECTRHFAQLMLGRLNKEFKKTTSGKTILVDMPYDTVQLHLPPKNTRGRKPKVEEKEIDTMEDEFVEYDDNQVADESANSEFEF
jgi:hypothetical protein